MQNGIRRSVSDRRAVRSCTVRSAVQPGCARSPQSALHSRRLYRLCRSPQEAAANGAPPRQSSLGRRLPCAVHRSA